MPTIDAIKFEKWTVRIILTAAMLFTLWFIIAEIDGLLTFGEYLWGTLTIIPDSIEIVVNHYQALPFEQLWPSLAIGGVLGFFATLFFLVAMASVSALPRISPVALLIGFIVAIVGYVMDMLPLNAIALGVLAIILSASIIQKEMRQAFADQRFWRLLTRQGGWIWLALGTLAGLLGSQILAYPTQHCTYAPEAPLDEYQLGVIITLVGAIALLLPFWTFVRQRNTRQNASTAGFFSGLGVPVLFLFPTILSLVIFLYYPAVEIVTTSLGQSNVRIPGRQIFVCLGNYTSLFEDVTYQDSLFATLSITIAIVIFGMSFALGIAVLASQKVRYAYVYRTLLIWPYALSPVVAGVIFFTMFQQDSGLINFALDRLFGVRPEWRSDVTLARIMVVFASVWNILGFNILFYVAGLQNVPKDLLEAAEIDGANRVQRFIRITFPLLSPFTFFLLVTNVTYAFYGIYGVIDVLTQGGPQFGPGGASGATEVLIYRLYEGGAQAGMAAAQALILFVMIAGFTLFQFGYIERRVTYAS